MEKKRVVTLQKAFLTAWCQCHWKTLHHKNNNRPGWVRIMKNQGKKYRATYPMPLLPPVMSATYPMPLLPPVMSATYPMPLLPPVISATLSKNRFIFMKNNLKKETGSSTPTLQARINLVSAKKIFKCCKQSSGELFGASERNLTCLKQY